ncbi:hypothetical protein [Mesorhizobium sp. WSM2239]|uniref:Uncharacterized protein n=2 Tax=unclassified Mesorhizobium TaxID=325217 RepID=A0AAU8DE29_9HYPH
MDAIASNLTKPVFTNAGYPAALKLLLGRQATRIKAEAGMIDEVTGNCDAAGLTLLHVLRERLDAAGLAALACSDFDRNLERNRDLASSP